MNVQYQIAGKRMFVLLNANTMHRCKALLFLRTGGIYHNQKKGDYGYILPYHPI
ncbi:MAG: hypothetical protein QM731_07215 [Chitinophagaceae bacterium]